MLGGSRDWIRSIFGGKEMTQRESEGLASVGRIGAYLLPGDPVWLASSLTRYYSVLDDLVVMAPATRRGWTGRSIPVDECLEIVARYDNRGIHRVVWGEWEDHAEPMRAETAQRQAGIDALGAGVDWVLQIDNDEVLPRAEALLNLLQEADRRSFDAVEWPMRVLYRRLRDGDFLEVLGRSGGQRYDYPGPIAVRSGSSLVDARRCAGTLLRPTVRGDIESLQLRQPTAPGEVRIECLKRADAIIHNSWGRDPVDVHRKVQSWGHSAGLKSELYYWTQWWPSPITWRLMRDYHPFAPGLWPKLGRAGRVREFLVDNDR